MELILERSKFLWQSPHNVRWVPRSAVLHGRLIILLLAARRGVRLRMGSNADRDRLYSLLKSVMADTVEGKILEEKISPRGNWSCIIQKIQ
jgi:hypothetical protein